MPKWESTEASSGAQVQFGLETVLVDLIGICVARGLPSRGRAFKSRRGSTPPYILWLLFSLFSSGPPVFQFSVETFFTSGYFFSPRLSFPSPLLPLNVFFFLLPLSLSLSLSLSLFLSLVFGFFFLCFLSNLLSCSQYLFYFRWMMNVRCLEKCGKKWKTSAGKWSNEISASREISWGGSGCFIRLERTNAINGLVLDFFHLVTTWRWTRRSTGDRKSKERKAEAKKHTGVEADRHSSRQTQKQRHVEAKAHSSKGVEKEATNGETDPTGSNWFDCGVEWRWANDSQVSAALWLRVWNGRSNGANANQSKPVDVSRLRWNRKKSAVTCLAFRWWLKRL